MKNKFDVNKLENKLNIIISLISLGLNINNEKMKVKVIDKMKGGAILSSLFFKKKIKTYFFFFIIN